MKRLVILSMAVLFSLSIVKGQVQKTGNEQNKETKKELKAERVALRKLSGNTVSIVAKNNFSTDFGVVTNAQWNRVDTFDQVTFTKDGKQETAFYDSEGKLVGVTIPKAISDIPFKAQQEIKTKYKDYTVVKVLLNDDNESNDTDMLLYGIQFDDADNYFVELTKGAQKIVLRVDMAGNVYFFKQL
jgi:hypothetical protein